MGCCGEKLKYERLKSLSHASILTSQTAHLLNKKMAVVKLTHQYYGDYYDGMDYDKAINEKRHIFRKFKPS